MTGAGGPATVHAAVRGALARPAVRWMAPLLAGRAAFRVVLYLSGPLLLLAWGRGAFNGYAAAVGSVTWLTVLVQAGPEKAVLKLVPRSRRTRGDLLRPLRAMVAWLPVPAALATLAALAAAPSATATLYLAAAAFQVAIGCTLLGTALHRSLGRSRPDLAAYAVLTAGIAAATGLALLWTPAPQLYLAGLMGVCMLVNVVLVRALPVPRPAGRRGVRGLLAGTVLLMGAPEVMTNAATSLLYVELALGPHAGQSGRLYLVLTVWSLVIVTGYFVQRMLQPAASARLSGEGAAAGQARARRIAWSVLAASAAWLAAAGAVLAALGPHRAASVPVLAVLLLSRAPLYLLMAYAAYLLENTGGRDLRTSAAGGAAGLAAVVLAGAAAVPLWGAAGAVYALGAKDLVLGAVVAARTGRRP
ncbi:hypothetical protein [Actinomadura parmotrematis]|uniref:Polysaccharide biosynthesis protein n=1 Tax=Actinomadura parmotrematis TaxID=2864039 RepID=A0ABS7FLP5_9ACTN|nr:hypothetical protein [Actinomadura parmotrematis]MBW8481165.1 hypothetical protein [Actinomadura parmotrematis]